MELEWNGPAATREWVDGYAAISDNFRLLNVGDAAGCPPLYPECGSTSHPEWTDEDVWYISEGADIAYSLPLIYRVDGGQAAQWRDLSAYGENQHGSKIDFLGSVSQYQACIDRMDPLCVEFSLNNRPTAAWLQLWGAVNADPDAGFETIDWSTDVTWQN
jgi:hypothetical protein